MSFLETMPLVTIALIALVLVSIPGNCFNFTGQLKSRNYLVLQKAYFDCKSFNVINKSNRTLTIRNGELFCEEDPFCRYFLFHNQKKEIRLCYDKGSILKSAKYDESWVTGIKDNVFENFAPSLVNAQGLCSHRVEKFFFNTLNEAIEKRKELNANFMILNFQSKDTKDGNIEGYFCEMIDDLVDRDGYVVFDFTKLEKPHQSCLRVRKCGLRGSVIPDDSKYEEGFNPGDVVDATKM